MGEFNPTSTIESISDLAKKADKMSHKWAKRNESPDSFKGFIASHKEFFGKASTVMGYVSFGFSVADAFGLFGPSHEKLVTDSLNRIEKSIMELKKEMIEQFENISNQISYTSANSKVAVALATIKTAKASRDKYVNALNAKNSSSKDLALVEFLSIPMFSVNQAITTLFNSFTSDNEDENILKSMSNYYINSPNTLLQRGGEIIMAIQNGIQVIGLHKRIELEGIARLKFKKINLGECAETINEDLKNSFFNPNGNDVNKLNIIWEKYVEEAVNSAFNNIPKFYKTKLVPKLSKEENNPTMICDILEANFPMIHFMVFQYNDCSSTQNHLLSTRDNTHISDFRQSKVNKNIIVWWNWRNENSIITDSKKQEIITIQNKLSQMDSALALDHEISHIIFGKINAKSLSDLSVGANAAVVRKSAAGVVKWAHSSGASIRASVKLDETGNFFIFWFVLD